MRSRFLAAVLAVALAVSPFYHVGPGVKEVVKAESKIPQGYSPIYSIEDVRRINNNLSGKYILMNDIDMSETARGGSWNYGTGWEPLGTFSGELNGNGYYIRNMNIFGDPGDSAGLFSKLYRATVSNLGIINCRIVINRDEYINVGAIAGTSNVSQIRNCFVTGDIEDVSEKYDWSQDQYVSSCMGGLVGYDLGGGGRIENCYNAANLSASDVMYGLDPGYSIGGIVGAVYMYFNNLDYCYNIGNIWGRYGQNVGGICGKGGSGGKSLYYLEGSVTGGSQNSWGYRLTKEQMRNIRTFALFSSEYWYSDILSGYEYPQLRKCPQKRVRSLEFTALPSKLKYFVGESLSLSGGQLSVTYVDGSKRYIILDDCTVTGYDAYTPGIQTITVSYINSTTYFSVGVEKNEEIKNDNNKEDVNKEDDKKENIPAESLKLDRKSLELRKGEKIRLTADILPVGTTDKNLKWETSDKDVVSVSVNGQVKGLKGGTAVITAETANGIQAFCKVMVKVPAEKIKLSVTKLQINKGQKKTLKATMTPSDATDTVSWNSNNPAVVSVSSKGVITAKKKGAAVITVRTSSGAMQNMVVTVLQPKGGLPDEIYSEIRGWWTQNSIGAGFDCKVTQTYFIWYDRITEKAVFKQKIDGCQNTKDGVLIRLGSGNDKQCFVYDKEKEALYHYYGSWTVTPGNHSASSSLIRGW